MSNCNCGGNCASCGGYAKELVLTPAEAAMLKKLAQTPFLPIARHADEEYPIYLEDSDYPLKEYSLILACMEKKGLIDLDYHQSLVGFDYSAYSDYPLHGSMALTARGQEVWETLELQGTQNV